MGLCSCVDDAGSEQRQLGGADFSGGSDSACSPPIRQVRTWSSECCNFLSRFQIGLRMRQCRSLKWARGLSWIKTVFWNRLTLCAYGSESVLPGLDGSGFFSDFGALELVFHIICVGTKGRHLIGWNKLFYLEAIFEGFNVNYVTYYRSEEADGQDSAEFLPFLSVHRAFCVPRGSFPPKRNKRGGHSAA